ncbi:MAG TPA: M48 family metalloprotease [Candidatus Saccharimonadales bacterium]|jgi:heat shock protein HtpX|nr:M48 family metalloprotease [Candidatus Saccharimonadales bacterium]
MYTQIAANKRKSILLTVIFVALVSALGYVYSLAFNRPGAFVFVAVFAVVYALVSYHFSANIALTLAGARPIAKADAPELYRTVENLAIAGGLPMPKVYIVNDPSPNAFATGRDPQHAVVAVTTGILQLLDKEELEGVIAHELSHVGNYDIRFMAVVMVLVTVVSLLSDFFFRWSFFGGEREEGNNPVALIIAIAAAILAPLVATMLQLAVSRRREYLADASGALLTRYPEGLARALEKIGNVNRPVQHASTATAHMYFTNPLAGRKSGSFVMNLFSTHPPIADRIQKLRAMEGQV